MIKTEQEVSQRVFNETTQKLQNRARFSELVKMSTISPVLQSKLGEGVRKRYSFYT